jgi:hypothetical protein
LLNISLASDGLGSCPGHFDIGDLLLCIPYQNRSDSLLAIGRCWPKLPGPRALMFTPLHPAF